VTAPLAGVVHRIKVVEGDVVEVKDLLMSLR
jgi:biotin carboxyl carrier protein